MGILLSSLINEDDNIQILTPYFTVKISPTKWVSVYKGYTNENNNGILIIVDNNIFYTLSILYTLEPIVEDVYFEIYKNFSELPVYTWGNIPNTISQKIKMGIWGLCDTTIEKYEELEQVF